MKKFTTFAVIACVAFAMGCNNSQKTASPGAVSEKGATCGDKAACEAACKEQGSAMGAVGEKNCAEKCSSEGKVCPVTGKAEGANMGAVSDSKSGCCKGSGATCTDKKAGN